MICADTCFLSNLSFLETQKSLPPLLVLDALCTSSEVTLANVRSYLLNVLAAEDKLAKREQELVQKYRDESERIRQQIHNIQTKYDLMSIQFCVLKKKKNRTNIIIINPFADLSFSKFQGAVHVISH